MREAGLRFRRGARVAFAVCAVCTLWLLVQNTLVIGWLALDRVPIPIGGLWAAGKALVATLFPLALITLTVALGALASRARAAEARHER